MGLVSRRARNTPEKPQLLTSRPLGLEDQEASVALRLCFSAEPTCCRLAGSMLGQNCSESAVDGALRHNTKAELAN